MEKNVYTAAALVAFLLVIAIGLYMYRPVENKLTRITVIGDSQTKIAPDTAVITFSVVTQGKQAIDAQQQNARKSEAVKTAVEAVTADAKREIKTGGYNLSPEQDYSSDRMPKIIGYEVKNTVVVSIDKLNMVGAIIDAATQAGANSVEGIQFVIGETSPAQGDALALATKQAMAKAEAIAASLGGKVVRVVESREGLGETAASADRFAYAMSNMALPAKPTTPIQSGSLDVRSQVILIVDISI